MMPVRELRATISIRLVSASDCDRRSSVGAGWGWWMMPMVAPYYGGGVLDRIWSIAALVAAGGTAFFAAAFLVGALDKELIAMLTRRRART